MIVDNDDAIYGKRTDQTELKLLCIYYLLLQLAFLKNFC